MSLDASFDRENVVSIDGGSVLLQFVVQAGFARPREL